MCLWMDVSYLLSTSAHAFQSSICDLIAQSKWMMRHARYMMWSFGVCRNEEKSMKIVYTCVPP